LDAPSQVSQSKPQELSESADATSEQAMDNDGHVASAPHSQSHSEEPSSLGSADPVMEETQPITSKDESDEDDKASDGIVAESLATPSGGRVTKSSLHPSGVATSGLQVVSDSTDDHGSKSVGDAGLSDDGFRVTALQDASDPLDAFGVTGQRAPRAANPRKLPPGAPSADWAGLHTDPNRQGPASGA